MKRSRPTALGAAEAGFLAEMDRRGLPVFVVKDHAADLPGIVAPQQLRDLLHSLCEKGRLEHIERGKYLVLPRAATGTWQEHPFVVAAGIAPQPSYVTGWAALAHQRLTTQLPRVVHVALREKTRKPINFQGTRYQFLFQHASRFYAYAEEEFAALNGAANVPVNVATPVKAILDGLDDERIAGGFEEIVGAVHRFCLALDESGSWSGFVDDVSRYPNLAVVARLGYILSRLSRLDESGDGDAGLTVPREVLDHLHSITRRAGSHPLLSTARPESPSAGDTTWRVRVNVPDDLFEQAVA